MDDIAEQFAWYADWAEDVSPLYERLARGTVEDSALLEIAAEASDGQPAPQLLLAAVHALLLRGVEDRLADFYPTCAADPIDPTSTDPFPAFREFCLENADRFREMVGSRRVQTNAVGRSAVLFPTFGYVVGTGARTPLATVEIGASAGLNLHWDRFRYRYEGYGDYGDPDSPVRMQTSVRGDRDPPLPDPVPEVEYRVGVDLNTLDVTDPADGHWLRALVIPDQGRRHDRLEAAIELAREDPPRLVEGDAVDVLPDVLDSVPADLGLCVFSTHTLYQLDEQQRERIGDLLVEHSRRRPVHWLSNDPEAEADHMTYRYIRLNEGIRDRRRLAEHEAYGAWIRWHEDDRP